MELLESEVLSFSLVELVLEEDEVLAVEGIDHFLAGLLALSLRVDVLHHVTRVLVHHELVNILTDLGADVLLQLGCGCVEVGLLGKVL